MKSVPARYPVLIATRRGAAGCALLLALALACGCAGNPPRGAATGSAPAAADAAAAHTASPEAALLEAIDALQDDERITRDGRILEAGSRYSAASGYQCRPVRFIDSDGRTRATQRLACSNGTRRFFATEVFSSHPGSRRSP